MSSLKAPGGRGLVYLLFFFSGATALVYEVVWGRQLTYVFGGSSLAVATVLAAYMAGLALGSFLFGRIADRARRPFLLYGILEGAIGVWALLLPALFRLVDPVYQALYQAGVGQAPLTLARFLLCFLLLLVPTTMMGGTLPVLLRYVALSMGRIGRTAAYLYALNTLGAVTGTMTAGFFLLPAAGLFRAAAIAAMLNLAIFALALWRGRVPMAPRSEAEEAGTGAAGAPASPERLQRAALWAYALSGFCALANEVIWTRVLLMSLGTTTYAFTTMLASFLLGLAAGSLIASRFVDRLRRPGVALALTQIGIALTALLAIPALGAMPRIFLSIFPLWGDSWTLQIATKFGLALLIMLPSTILLGMTFPLVTRIVLTGLGDVGRRVGVLYAWNTVGAIAGSLTAGFLLLPVLGRQPALLLVVALNALTGLYLLMTAAPGRRILVRVLAPSAAALALLSVPAARTWDVHLTNSGVYVYAARLRSVPDAEKVIHASTLLFQGEDSEAVISVWNQDGVLSLRTNGKVEASTSEDMPTQKLIAHLPLLFHENPKQTLLVGLASGITLGAMLAHPIEKAVTIELLPSMVEASGVFRRENRNALEDPRTELLIEDGRNFLHQERKLYDVIVSEPSNPWIAGLSNLFSREFFRLASSRLAPHGVLCQWVQIYDMRADDLKAVLRTFCDVFPHVTLWWVAPTGDLILLGSREPGVLDPQRLVARAWPERVREDLASIGVESNAGLLSNYIASERKLRGYVGSDGPRVTDDNLILEFAVPKNFYRSMQENVLEDVYAIREPLVVPVRDASGVERPLDLVASRYRALQAALDPDASREKKVEILEASYRENPEDPFVKDKLAENRNALGAALLQAGEREAARAQFEQAGEEGIPAEQLLARGNLGLLSYEAGDLAAAEASWRWALERDPRNPGLHYNLGQVLTARGHPAGAEAAYREALRWGTKPPDHLNALAWILAEQGGTKAREAVSLAERAVEAEASANYLDTLGFALIQTGDAARGREALERAAKADPSSAEIQRHLALACSKLGDEAGARAAAQRALALEPAPRDTSAAPAPEISRPIDSAGSR